MSGVRMAQVKVETATDRVTVQEAANRLGVKDDAIRKRIQRGTLDYEKDPDGRVYVFINATHDSSKDSTRHPNGNQYQDSHNETSKDESKDKLINVLQDQIQYLRNIIEARDRELEARTDELRRKDTIIMSLTQRLPELPPASSPEETHNGLLHSPGKIADEKTSEDQLILKRSWWRRLIGS